MPLQSFCQQGDLMQDDRSASDFAEIQEIRAVLRGDDGKTETPGRIVTELLWPPIPTLESLPRLPSSFGTETNYLGEPRPAA